MADGNNGWNNPLDIPNDPVPLPAGEDIGIPNEPQHNLPNFVKDTKGLPNPALQSNPQGPDGGDVEHDVNSHRSSSLEEGVTSVKNKQFGGEKKPTTSDGAPAPEFHGRG
ncbi:hypothetical protein CPB86DRAFT_389314 [Serendipita vermifera]|nr:hypothetical protein CPB86DRAFT_389314 [Serendipita vermifera]